MTQAAPAKKDQLVGRTLWIPRMTYIGARMMASVLRSTGVDARVCPPSNDQTLELGGLYSSGEECYPLKVTLGDFLRIVNRGDFDPAEHAFFMPTAEGPCRFGQYGQYLRVVLDEMGYHDVPIISPTSKNSYDGLGEKGGINTIRCFWRGLVAADLTRKMLLKTRPYETQAGAADAAYAESMDWLDEVLSRPGRGLRKNLSDLVEVMHRIGNRFRAVPARYEKGRPLIGVVGEIFCRLNTFSNDDAVRKIEAHGGEVWLSDVAEWVWYTNWSQKNLLKRDGKAWTLDMLGAVVKNAVQKRDEHKLLEPLAEEFIGLEEPENVYEEVLEPGWPYLPADGALGEMVLSVGKSIYLYEKGADGIIDISPFSCMNGIVCEAVYHAVAADHEEMPIRNFYFDASSSNMDRDLDIFMELASAYQKRKSRPRQYGPMFA